MLENRPLVAFVTLGVITLGELALIGVLAFRGLQIPDQAWSLLYATLGIIGGVAGAQYLNGKTLSK